MAKQNLFNRLLGRQQQQEQEAARDFHSFVVQVADGEVTDPDKILDALQRMGETPLTLQQALDKLAERRAWQEQLTGEAETLKQLTAAEKRQTAFTAERVKIRKEWQERGRAIDAELESLQLTANSYETIRGKLRNSFADPVLRNEERQLIARKSVLREEGRKIRGELQVNADGYRTTPARLSNLRSMLRVAERQLEDAKIPRQKIDCQKKVESLGKQVGACEKEQAPLHDRLERIGAECEVIDREQHKIDEAKILVA